MVNMICKLTLQQESELHGEGSGERDFTHTLGDGSISGCADSHSCLVSVLRTVLAHSGYSLKDSDSSCYDAELWW